MSTVDDIVEELKTLQDSLQVPYAKAKAAGDEAEMKRLLDIYDEIDIVIDDAILTSLRELAAELTKIKKKIDGHKVEADKVADSISGLSLAELKALVGSILKQSEEEDLAAEPDVAAEPEPEEEIDISTEVAAPDPGPQDTGNLVLSEAHLIALWKRSLFPIDGKGMIVFGLRGSRPVDYSGTGFEDRHEIVLREVNYKTMNCTIGQWRPNHGFALFPGSTVPYISIVERKISNNGVGVNQMGKGRYKKYQAGWHKRSEGSGGHWALRQECPITIQRTGDDADYDLDDRWEVGRIAGDNIHCAFHMGVDGQIPDTRFSSAGCQTIAGTVRKGVKGSEQGPWKKFIAPFHKGLGNQQNTEYVLFSADEAQQMIRNQYKGKTVILRIGSSGPLVRKLQAALAKKLHRTIKADGDFGPTTFRAVLDFQTEKFGSNADDGIVGSGTASALGFELPAFDFKDAVSGGPGYKPDPADTQGADTAPGTPAAGPGVSASDSDKIAWGAKTNDLHGKAFKSKVIAISKRIKCDPNHLMAVMAFETGRTFKPDKENQAGSGAIGLIQFMPKTATWLGTSTAKLKKMSALEQLDFVEEYFKRLAGNKNLNTLSDVYMVVLYPKSVGELESFVLFTKPSKAYKQNKGLDKNNDGLVTKSEAAAKAQRQLELGLKASNMG